MAGDLAANAGTLFSNAGVGIAKGINALASLVTDGEHRARVADGVGHALRNPAEVAAAAKNGVEVWAAKPLVEQVRDVGELGVEVLASGGAVLLGKKATTALTSRLVRRAAGTAKELVYRPSSGVVLQPTPGKTTTILGNYAQDMQFIVKELDDRKSTRFGPRVGGFNVLNVPDELYRSPQQFWVDYNKPWLSSVMERSDPILMATEPKFGPGSKLFKLNDATGKLELSGLGKEYLYLRKNGYGFDPMKKSMTRTVGEQQ